MSDSVQSTRQLISGRPSDVAVIFWLGLFLFGVYLLTYGGYVESSDSVSMYAVAESVAKRGQFDTGPFIWDRWTAGYQDAQGDFGADGDIYSKKGLGEPLAAAPLTWVALHLPGLGLIHTTYLFNPIVTALTAIMLGFYVLRLGYGRDTALLVGGFYGLATLAWPYTRTFYSEPFMGFLLLLSAYFGLAFHQESKWQYLLGSGLALGWAAVTRVTNLTLLPILLVYTLGPMLWGMRPPPDKAKAKDWLPGWEQTARAAAVLCLSIGAALLVIALYNYVRFHTPFRSGYAQTVGFWTPLGEGLYGLFLSPGKGLFFYAPALALSVISLPFFIKRHGREGAFLLALFLAPTVMFAKWMDWEGGLAWGPRYLVGVLPLLAPFVAPGLAWLLGQLPPSGLRPGWQRLRCILLALVALLVLWSVSIQAFASSVNFVRYLRIPRALAENWTGSPFALSPPLLPFVFSPSIIGREQIRLAWFRLVTTDSVVILWLPLAAAACLTLLTLAGLLWLRARPTGRRSIALSAGGVALALLIAGVSLNAYYGAPDRGAGDDYTALVEFLARHERPNDVLLVSNHTYMGFFMNYNKARMKWYCLLSKQEDPSSDEAALLARLIDRHPRLWLAIDRVPALGLPRPAEKWLVEHTYPVAEQVFSDYCRLCLYVAADRPSPDAPQRELLRELGHGIRLLGYDLHTDHGQNDLASGESLRFSLLWEATDAPDGDYVVFVQMLDEGDRLAWQSDRRPAAGFRPTGDWRPGQRVRDNYGLIVPAEWSAGHYRLIAGMYDPQTGVRLAMADAAGRPAGDWAALGGPLTLTTRQTSDSARVSNTVRP